jgi:outer membrane protein, heavy metal efflux system
MHHRYGSRLRAGTTLIVGIIASQPTLAQTTRSSSTPPPRMPMPMEMQMPMGGSETQSGAASPMRTPEGRGGAPASESSSLPLPIRQRERMPGAGMSMPAGGMSMPAGRGQGPMSETGVVSEAAGTAASGRFRLRGSGTGVTLDRLESIALGSNPTLLQAQAQVEASMSKSFQAGLMPNPIAGYISEQMGAGGGPGETQGGFYEQELMRGGKLRLSRAKYRQEAVQAQIQVLAQQMRIVNGVRMLYFDVLAAQELVEIERELLQNHEELLRTMREMANVGQANRPEVLQAQIAAQRQRIALRTAENRLRKSWQGLLAMVGCPQLPHSRVAGDIEQDMPPLEFEQALQRIIDHSPEVQVARAEVLRDEITVRRERVQPIPNAFLRVETGYNWEVALTTVGVSYGWNFPIFNRNQGTIREAMAEVARARAEVTRLELWLRRQLADEFADYQTAQATVQTYRFETLPQAREAYQLTLGGFRQRRTPWAQVVLSQRTYSDLVEEYIEALLQLRHSEVEINGLLLVDGLAQPEPPTPGGHIDATPQPR